MFKSIAIKYLALLFFSLALCKPIHAQETFATACADFVSPNFSVSYTVGQLFYQSKTVSNTVVMSGIQHPVFSIYTQIEDEEPIVDFKIHPNPVERTLHLTINHQQVNNYTSLQLYSINGDLIIDKEIIHSQVAIDMSQFPASIYLMKFFSESVLIEEIKILKK